MPRLSCHRHHVRRNAPLLTLLLCLHDTLIVCMHAWPQRRRPHFHHFFFPALFITSCHFISCHIIILRIICVLIRTHLQAFSGNGIVLSFQKRKAVVCGESAPASCGSRPLLRVCVRMNGCLALAVRAQRCFCYGVETGSEGIARQERKGWVWEEGEGRF